MNKQPMTKQQILAKIMLELNSMGLVQSVNIKSQNDLDLFLQQLGMGLEESDLMNMEFLSNGFKEIRSGRAGVKDFYPSVPTFIAACTPKPEQYGMATAEEARLMAAQNAYSHSKCDLEPLVQMAAKHHWSALGEGKGNKEFRIRYLKLFNQLIRGKLVLETMPKPIEKAPPSEDEIKQTSEAGKQALKSMMKQLGGNDE